MAGDAGADKFPALSMTPPPADVLWLPEARLHELTPDAHWRSWLLERGSMTVRLQSCYAEVRVEVESQGLATVLGDEAQALGLDPARRAWVRQVTLWSGAQVLLQARSVVPGWAPGNAWHELEHLGTQPLGHLLFSMPDISRSPFEVAWVPSWPDLRGSDRPRAGEDAPRLARRCLYGRRGCALLLTERLWLSGAVEPPSA